MPELTIGGIPAEDLHRISHNTLKFLNVGWITPDVALGPTAVKLNLLRAYCRDVEIAAVDAHGGATHLDPLERDRMMHGLNRLSNALYVLVAKVAGKK
jgi:ethanolamine utilization cobalamin adenosyltransferase